MRWKPGSSKNALEKSTPIPVSDLFAETWPPLLYFYKNIYIFDFIADHVNTEMNIQKIYYGNFITFLNIIIKPQNKRIIISFVIE